MKRFAISTIFLALVLTGCGSDGKKFAHVDLSNVKNAVPRFEPYSKAGNDPYRVFGKTYVPLRTAQGFEQRGIASWYGKKFHGKPTSNGERYDMYAMTAAHKTLPLPSYVSVTNLKNNKMVIVRVNDRGPFVGDRIIDLSYAAASKLDLVQAGTGPVLVRAMLPDGSAYDKLPGQEHYLAAGTFSNKDNATKLRNKLRSVGFDDALIKQKRTSGRTLYQVRIGPVDVSDNIDNLIRKVGRYLSEEPIIVTE